MSTDKRTRAELIATLNGTVDTAAATLEASSKRWAAEVKTLQDRLDRQTPEARAIDMCVAALDALKKAQDSSHIAGNFSSPSSWNATYAYEPNPMPQGSVAHALAFLRLRYGIADNSGQVEHLTQRVNTLVNENGQLRQQLQRIAEAAQGGGF